MQTNSFRLSALLIFLLLAASSCKEKHSKIDELGRANAPAPHGTAPMAPPSPAEQVSTPSSGKIHEGTILETIDVKDYTYIRFKDAQDLEHWAAVLKGEYEIGKKIAITESVVMKNFNSPTLNRTFDSIIFGNAADKAPPAGSPDAPATLPEGHPPIDSDSPQKSPRLPEGHPPVN